MYQDDETKPPLVKKEEPVTAEPKQEVTESAENKTEIKTEPKEEDDNGASGTSAASATQNRKKGGDRDIVCMLKIKFLFLMYLTGVEKNDLQILLCYFCEVYFNIVNISPVFKPEELRQALMPTLEALYRQDPESLPFRQPVDPMLLGIPVSIFNYICRF